LFFSIPANFIHNCWLHTAGEHYDKRAFDLFEAVDQLYFLSLNSQQLFHT